MATNYAPIIGEIIPAFTEEEIIIPFKHNPAVSNSVRKNMDCFILDFKTGNQKCMINLKDTNGPIQSPASFTIPQGKVTPGDYYKIQLSYEQNGPRSYVSVAKCIEEPTVELNGFIGSYQQGNSGEKLYSYQFRLYNNSSSKLLEDTGELVYYYSDNDTNNISVTYTPYREFETGLSYKLKFTITTINGYTKTVTTTISNTESSSEELGNIEVLASPQPDNGSVLIKLKNSVSNEINCELLRENINFPGHWEGLTTFKLNENSDLTGFEYQDLTVEHNTQYRYAIRQIADNGVPSKKITSNSVSVGFDDIFLSDENCMLKIKFNPKISSFKETLQETKTDTIGSKYPFFFKNGQVGYKEIPISGLISHLMDDMESFISANSLGINTTDGTNTTTQLSDDNIMFERKFKMAVLDWLNNGKPKLFRSPTEGNYLIRLMNVSLSPTEQLGRMLHTFSATGYEVGDLENTLKLFKKEIVVPNLREKGIELDNFVSTYARSNNNGVKIDGDNISNIVWKTNTPGFLSKIILDNEVFYNISGEFKTEKDKCYNEVIVYFNTEDNAYNSFVYDRDILPAAAAARSINQNWTFDSAMQELNYQINSYTHLEEVQIKAYYLEVMIVRKDLSSFENNNYIIINDEYIDLHDEQPRTFYELGYNLRIQKPKGIHLDISGYYKEV